MIFRQTLAAAVSGFALLCTSMALDTTSIDGQKLPQGLMFSLGFEINW